MSAPSSLALANQVDQVKAFMLYSFFGGDIVKTAAAANVDVRIIQALEHDFSWASKITGQSDLSTPEGLTAEQAANRGANYVMAKRFGAILESVITSGETEGEPFLERMCIDTDEKGNKTFTTKPLMEIAKTLEILNNMTYRALGDKVAAKAEGVADTAGKADALALGIYKGMAKMAAAVREVREGNPTLEINARAVDVVGQVVTPLPT